MADDFRYQLQKYLLTLEFTAGFSVILLSILFIDFPPPLSKSALPHFSN